ncbi:mandelate racemase [Bacteriovorax sp. Seq25_V]|uniref:mandelate racemase n=1 Tax=Bacteriovorax sp. Seq25_V TaxID=1201288 RepID=UPI000389E146|nr:mandelate racemase [Bacteriovorax sp. Seq25_V]EQC44402.1 mandelate racemase/muconate lactonizing enzyme, C-terminal domain protein [Bacteriovorax sp. Seq25_V]
MKILIEEGSTRTHYFKNQIPWKGQLYTETYSKELDFFFIDNTNQYQILGEVNQLPLFWKDQKQSLPTELELRNLACFDLTKPYFNLIDDLKLDANFQFAIEQALLAFLDIKNLLPIYINLNSTPLVEVSALQTKFDDNVKTRGTQKLKIGQRDSIAENELLKSFTNTDIKLRLDANRSLSVTQLEKILKDIPASLIEYIEEPFLDINEWQTFNRRSEFKLALDETVIENNFDVIFSKFRYSIKALILKPSYNSSISNIFKLLDNDSFKEIDLVLSSSYEPAQSLNTLLHLGHIINKKRGNDDLAHGLGTITQMQQQDLFSPQGTKVQAYTFSHFSL